MLEVPGSTALFEVQGRDQQHPRSEQILNSTRNCCGCGLKLRYQAGVHEPPIRFVRFLVLGRPPIWGIINCPTVLAERPGWRKTLRLLTYLPNQGQVYDLAGNFRNDVYFSSVGTFPTLFLMKANRIGIVIPELNMEQPANSLIHRLDLQFVGAHASQPVPHVYESTDHLFNFFETYTPHGVTGVQGGKRVVYEDVYPGIDVHMYSNKWGPKMYIVVRPHANPNDIKILCTGQDSLKLDQFGFLSLYFDTKFVKLSQGMTYQQVGNTTTVLPWIAHYEIASDSLHVGFEFGDYDPDLPLIFIIRPLNPNGPLQGGDQPQPPEWCTYLGGGGADVIRDLTHDSDGYLYYTGGSRSGNGIPVNPDAAQLDLAGGNDIILGRVNEFYEMQTPDQTVWTTFYGGIMGDEGASIVYDNVNDRLILAGELTASENEIPNRPLAGNPDSYSRTSGLSNAFFSFFDPAFGLPLFLSRLPGQTSGGRNIDVDFDAFGNTYVLTSGLITIQGSELTIPIAGAYNQYMPPPVNSDPQHGYDGFVMQFDPMANLLWKTYYGGPNNDYAAACAVDRSTNRLTIAGTTTTANSGASDACTAAAGDVELPLCGSGNQFLQTGLNSNNTQGVLVPEDGFIAQFDLTTRTLVWSTYFGGPGSDGIMDIASNGGGDLYMVGYSASSSYSSITCGPTDAAPGFPSCPGGFGSYYNAAPAGRKFFIAHFNGNTLKWCTRFGDTHQFNYEDSQLRVTTDEHGRPLVFGSSVYTNAGFTQPLEPTILSNTYNRLTHNDVAAGPKADCFVGLFSDSDALLYATYFGGIGNDLAGAIEAFEGRIYIGGSVYAGMNFPTHEPVIAGHNPYLDAVPAATANVPDAFLAQLKYDFTIGLEEQHVFESEGLLLYPNPTNGLISVALPSDLSMGTLEVADGLGRLVLQHSFRGTGKQVIDLSRVANGSYTVTLRSSSGVKVGRVIKVW